MEQKLYSSQEVVQKLDISLRQLYYWELKGIVTPDLIKLGSREFKRYSVKQFNILKNVKRYKDQGFTLEAATKKALECLG